jgi:hypothetical protein
MLSPRDFAAACEQVEVHCHSTWDVAFWLLRAIAAWTVNDLDYVFFFSQRFRQHTNRMNFERT